MNWEDTVIKSKDIKLTRPRIKSVNDGSLDFNLRLPLTGLLRGQAKMAFSQGMLIMLLFHVKHQVEERAIETDDLVGLFNGCGLPEIAKQLEAKQEPK